MTNKDIEITTVALLKSIIEGGQVPKEEWHEALKVATVLWITHTNKWKKQQETSNGR